MRDIEMAKTKKERSMILLFPTDQQLKIARNKLPRLKPHDLRSLINEAQANNKVVLNTAVLGVLRRRNDIQMKELLRCLGVDPLGPDAWQRGFFLLAAFHHGVGHLAWYPHRTNRNAATWTSSHDLALLREVMTLRERGVSERNAVKKLAADPQKRQLFPYRRQGHFSTADEQNRREAALWARLQKLRASTRGKSFEHLILGTRLDSLSSIERALYDLDLSNSLPVELVKNQSLSKTVGL
jgi:hypothetical protein